MAMAYRKATQKHLQNWHNTVIHQLIDDGLPTEEQIGSFALVCLPFSFCQLGEISGLCWMLGLFYSDYFCLHCTTSFTSRIAQTVRLSSEGTTSCFQLWSFVSSRLQCEGLYMFRTPV